MASDLGAFKAHYSRSIHREPDALVFATRNGGPLMSNNLRRGLRSACGRAELPRLNWHALRHTHGTLLHSQGTPLKVAQAQLGHSHLTTTLEVYTHASVTAQREAVDFLDKQVFPIVPNNTEASVKKEPAICQLIDISRLSGAPGVIRTRDLLLRRQALYPAELRAHKRRAGNWNSLSCPSLPRQPVLVPPRIGRRFGPLHLNPARGHSFFVRAGLKVAATLGPRAQPFERFLMSRASFSISSAL